MDYKPFSKLFPNWRFASRPPAMTEDDRQFFLALDKEVESDRKALAPLLDKYRDVFLAGSLPSDSPKNMADADILARALGAQRLRS